MKYFRFSALAVAATLSVSACDAVVQPTSVEMAPAFAVGDRYAETSSQTPGVGLVCSFYPDMALPAAPGTYAADATGGDVIGGTFELSGIPACIEVWNATDATEVMLTGTLVDAPEGFEIDRIITLVGAANDADAFPGPSATVAVSDLVGASIWFKLKAVDTPPGGGQGCTPGYWRQEHHYDSWTSPYDPSDLFSEHFADAFPGQTLGEVVRAKGGGINALGRHAVAAVLNAASGGVDYDLTQAQIIDAFNAAYASGDKSTMNNQKDIFDFLNNQGCSLN